MMRHYSKYVGIYFTCELQYEELKTVVRYRPFSANASGGSVISHSLLNSNLHDEISINQDENDTDNIQDAIINSVFLTPMN